MEGGGFKFGWFRIQILMVEDSSLEGGGLSLENGGFKHGEWKIQAWRVEDSSMESGGFKIGGWRIQAWRVEIQAWRVEIQARRMQDSSMEGGASMIHTYRVGKGWSNKSLQVEGKRWNEIHLQSGNRDRIYQVPQYHLFLLL